LSGAKPARRLFCSNGSGLWSDPLTLTAPIQLRSLSTRFTDASPPRVGIVQAENYQGRATTQYITSHYVIDDKGEPLKGVFAVLHVGQEDALDKISKRSAFLALSGRIREELIAKVTEMFDEAEKDQRYSRC
jgi:hypothetical protein